MTPKQAYQMGFRHVTDLAEINRVADLCLADDLDCEALQLVEAWRQGVMAAAAMIERRTATLH